MTPETSEPQETASTPPVEAPSAVEDDELEEWEEPVPPNETREQRKNRITREHRRKAVMEKRAKALQARLRGMSWEQVAKAAGYKSKGAAYNAVQEELAKIPREPAQQLLQVELETLSFAQVSIIKQVSAGSVEAVGALLKVIDQRARLTGLYKLEQEQQTGAEVKKVLLGFMQAAAAFASGETDDLERHLDEPPAVPEQEPAA